MADQVDGRMRRDGIDHRAEVLRQPLQAVGRHPFGRRRAAGAPHVIGNYVIVIGQQRRHAMPDGAVVRIAVHQHDGRARGIAPGLDGKPHVAGLDEALVGKGVGSLHA